MNSKIPFLFLLLLWALPMQNLPAQITLQGVVKDAETRSPLPFSSVRVRGTTTGTVANVGGSYILRSAGIHDSIMFSYVGYQTVTVPASLLITHGTVFLVQKPEMLAGVSVYAREDYLYKMVERCGKRIRKQSGERTAKAYFGLETFIGERPAELLECYYNAVTEGVQVEALLLKNGRIGLAVVGSRLFNSIETSKAISRFSLVRRNSLFPAVPTQFSMKEMQKAFVLTPGRQDEAILHVRFAPRQDSGSYFKGEMWIDKESASLIQMNLSVDTARIFPFESLWDDSVRNVNMELVFRFFQFAGRMVPEYIRFNYNFDYETASSEARLVIDTLPDMLRRIETRSILSFYDYGEPFILPWFEYDPDESDYHKLAMIPYNDFFWNHNSAMLLTGDQRNSLGFYADKGMLVNFGEGNHGKNFLKMFNSDTVGYNFPYAFWGTDSRVRLNKNMPQNETWSQDRIKDQIPSDLYHLEVKILLDVTQARDTFHEVSYTVFDETQTFFHLPPQPCTNLFLNLYFDICEIERRKMEAVLHQNTFTINQIDSLYQSTTREIEGITGKYLKEVQQGKNRAEMEKWNQYVFDRLRIDNLALFRDELGTAKP
ncbi:MAG TPA: carboxypeptidase-like regulatory domain-containing protein [Bacteroidales bacterium]|nr:carboxypeptidase-like regulatory domain-containing protein [Bacteroidales bacterium]HRZ50254.1 carboxypeptidase-like regulatory domain-containing protein [Bacteroidales bacterium]